MRFNYYRIIYFNIILIVLFWLNQFCLFFLIFFFKIPYVLNLESDIEYQYNFQAPSMEDVGSSYLENDIDNDFYYTLQHMQSYLYSNCRFFFDVLGGELTLDYIDFIDFTIYKINDNNVLNINRNYKYIYNNKIVLHTLKHFNIFKMYNIIEDAKNNNYNNVFINYLENFKNNKQNNNIIYNKEKLFAIIKSNKLTLYDKQIKIQEKIINYKIIKKKNNLNNIFMFDEKIIEKVKIKLRKKT
jgi:hypothetical protein